MSTCFQPFLNFSFFLLSAVKSVWVSSLHRLWLRQPPVAPLWRTHGAQLSQLTHQFGKCPVQLILSLLLFRIIKFVKFLKHYSKSWPEALGNTGGHIMAPPSLMTVFLIFWRKLQRVGEGASLGRGVEEAHTCTAPHRTTAPRCTTHHTPHTAQQRAYLHTGTR